MDLLTEIADDRLVIMVTHNPDLAEQYATRTVNLADGRVTSDSNPFTPSIAEIEAANADKALYEARPYLNITTWGADDVNIDANRTGKAGSPTFVKEIQSVVLTAKESKKLTGSDADINEFVKDIIDNHILG
jgi:energy-coupling factor transporter ATP-binding protein EcfA2